jgi:hypothetical protein
MGANWVTLYQKRAGECKPEILQFAIDVVCHIHGHRKGEKAPARNYRFGQMRGHRTMEG